MNSKERKILNELLRILDTKTINSELINLNNDQKFISKEAIANDLNISVSKLLYLLRELEEAKYVMLKYYKGETNLEWGFISEEGRIFIENDGYKPWYYKWNEWQIRLEVIGKLTAIIFSIVGIISVIYTLYNSKNTNNKIENNIHDIDSLKVKISGIMERYIEKDNISDTTKR